MAFSDENPKPIRRETIETQRFCLTRKRLLFFSFSRTVNSAYLKQTGSQETVAEQKTLSSQFYGLFQYFRSLQIVVRIVISCSANELRRQA